MADRVHEQALTYAVLQIGLKSWEEFSLRKASLDAKGIPTPSDWLYDDQTMPEQNVKDSDELFFLKRYYFNDDYVDKDDPFSLHLLFVGANKMVVNGEYLISKNEARDFAALQLQVNHGDFDKEKEKVRLSKEKRPVEKLNPLIFSRTVSWNQLSIFRRTSARRRNSRRKFSRSTKSSLVCRCDNLPIFQFSSIDLASSFDLSFSANQCKVALCSIRPPAQILRHHLLRLPMGSKGKEAREEPPWRHPHFPHPPRCQIAAGVERVELGDAESLDPLA